MPKAENIFDKNNALRGYDFSFNYEFMIEKKKIWCSPHIILFYRVLKWNKYSFYSCIIMEDMFAYFVLIKTYLLIFIYN